MVVLGGGGCPNQLAVHNLLVQLFTLGRSDIEVSHIKAQAAGVSYRLQTGGKEARGGQGLDHGVGLTSYDLLKRPSRNLLYQTMSEIKE